MDIYTLNRGINIQEKLKTLKREKELWESAKELCGEPKIFDGNESWNIKVHLIDFKELKNRTFAYINSKIEALEKEFKEL